MIKFLAAAGDSRYLSLVARVAMFVAMLVAIALLFENGFNCPYELTK